MLSYVMRRSVGLRGLRSAVCGFAVFGAALVLSAPRAAKAATACIDGKKLPGVASDCKDKAEADEIDPSGNTVWSTNELFSGAGCAPKACVIKRDSALCVGVAKLKSVQGTFGCYASGDCEKFLSQDAAAFGELCPSGQSCCVAKAGAKKAAPAAKPGSPVTLPDPLSGMNFPKLLGNIIRTFSGIAGAIALLMFVYGGIMWILSGGTPDKIKKAQQILANASIGLVLIFGAYTFVSSIIDVVLAPPGQVEGGAGGENVAGQGQ